MTFLRVMTLNNFNSVLEDEIECFADVWANRAAFNVKTLKRYDPDILGLQEFEPVHWATYQQKLSGYGHAIANEHGPGTAVLWKEERFELLDHGFLTLPRSDVPHLADLEDEILLETTWVRLCCRQSGVELLYLNTHLNDASEEARGLGIARNLQQLTEMDPGSNLPVIMAGGFNCNPWSPVCGVFHISRVSGSQLLWLRKCLKRNGCQSKGGVCCGCEDTTIPKRFD